MHDTTHILLTVVTCCFQGNWSAYIAQSTNSLQSGPDWTRDPWCRRPDSRNLVTGQRAVNSLTGPGFPLNWAEPDLWQLAPSARGAIDSRCRSDTSNHAASSSRCCRLFGSETHDPRFLSRTACWTVLPDSYSLPRLLEGATATVSRWENCGLQYVCRKTGKIVELNMFVGTF